MRSVHSLWRKASAALALFAAALMMPGAAFAGDNPQGFAQKTLGAPFVDQMGLTSAVDSIKVHVDWFHRALEVLITFITFFVFALLVIVVVRFRKSVHPVASTRSHNGPLELVWTLIPALIVLAMLFPSWTLMFYMDKAKNPEMTVKITGHQWYWGYEFPQQKVADKDIAIDEYPSNIIPADKIDKSKGQLRLLSVDDPLVIPVNTEIQFLITGADVIHSWYVPSFGVNRSAMPGRTNESWAKVTHEGVFYGQCSKICGLNHGYMPIEVHVVSKEKFQQWAAIAKASGVDKANAAILGTKTAALNAPTAVASSAK